MVPPRSYPPILAGTRGLVCMMPLTPSLVQVSIEFLRLLNSIGLTDPPVGGGIVCILPLTPSLVQGLLTTPSSHNLSARLSSPEY